MDKHYHLDKWYHPPLEFDGICISQIGRLYCSSETVVATHQHIDLFELTIVSDGKGIVTTNGVPVPVEPGYIYLSLPGDTHKIESDSHHPLKFDFFAFNCDCAPLHDDFEYISQNYYPPNMRIFRNEQVRQLIGNAISELNHENKYSKELLSSIFRQIIIYIIRGFADIQPKKYPDTVTDAEVLCYRLMNYIDTHIYSMKALGELAVITDYSYGYLSAVFKKTTNDTLANYYYRRKLETARQLLVENRLKITEIAEMLNYSSVYALSKAFTNYFGMSPRHYRENYLKENN